jgi:hypothetical protein
VLFCANAPIFAAEYKVEFTQDGSGSQVIDIVKDELKPTSWHTINDHDGVNLRNMTGFVVVSIRMKATQAGDTFLVDQKAGGDVFKTVWRRKDNTEVAFLDGDIKKTSIIWNRVNDTSGSTITTGDIFEGQIYKQNYVIPDPENWVPVRVDRTLTVADSWQRLKQLLPRSYKTIDAYVTSGDSQQLFFVSRGFPFLLDLKSNELRPVLVRMPVSKGMNHVEIVDGAAVFSRNGIKVLSVPLDKKDQFGDPIHPD